VWSEHGPTLALKARGWPDGTLSRLHSVRGSGSTVPPAASEPECADHSRYRRDPLQNGRCAGLEGTHRGNSPLARRAGCDQRHVRIVLYQLEDVERADAVKAEEVARA
jgi:hypothetical protein